MSDLKPPASPLSSFRRSVGAVFVVALAAFAFLGGCTPDPTDKDIEYISLTELRTLMSGKDADQTMLVDPRAPEDFAAGHIPGAQNHGINSERAKVGTGLNPVFSGYKHLIVYGEDPAPGPAQAMAKRLMSLKAKKVRVFGGGMMEWKRAGLQVEKSEGAKENAKASAEAGSGKPGAADK